MKNKYLTMTLPILLLTIGANADEGASSEIAQVKKTKIAPAVMATKTPFIEYHNRMSVFSVTHLAYERIQPNALYAGVEAWIAESARLHHRWDHMNSWVGEAEFRLGYNFFYNGRDHVTPIAGVGYLTGITHFRHHNHHRWLVNKGVVYGTVGCLYDHEFNSIFNLGLNVKALAGGFTGHTDLHKGSAAVGCDVAIPITFRFGHKRHWDFRIEPFDIYLKRIQGTSYNFFGFRSTIGYRF